VHDEAPRAEDTDWPQILALYGLLEHVAPSPMVTLNRTVAIAMVQGPEAGLDLVATVDVDSHHVASVRAHLVEMQGDLDAAPAAYRLTTSDPERRHLVSRATTEDPPDSAKRNREGPCSYRTPRG
jgi:predicted RNA polymerase sigma factor